MEFYKCATVYGPKTVSGFIVSGAGTVAVNGNYLPTDLKSPDGVSPVYKHETEEYYYYEAWGEIGICDDYETLPSDGLYYIFDSEWTVSGGVGPAPTVTAGNITLNSDVPKTWNGYKAVLVDGVYSFEDTLTEGMTYGDGYIPTVGKAYNSDATIMAKLFMQYPADAIFSNCDTLPDNNLTTTNCVVDTNVKKFGSGSIQIQSDGVIKFDSKKTLHTVGWTAAHFFYADTYTGGDGVSPLINNDSDVSGEFLVGITSSGCLKGNIRDGSQWSNSEALTSGWHHVRIVHPPYSDIIRLYLDGVFMKEFDRFGRGYSKNTFLGIGKLVYGGYQFTGNIDGIEFFELDEERLAEYTGSSAPVPEKPF